MEQNIDSEERALSRLHVLVIASYLSMKYTLSCMCTSTGLHSQCATLLSVFRAASLGRGIAFGQVVSSAAQGMTILVAFLHASVCLG